MALESRANLIPRGTLDKGDYGSCRPHKTTYILLCSPKEMNGPFLSIRSCMVGNSSQPWRPLHRLDNFKRLLTRHLQKGGGSVGPGLDSQQLQSSLAGNSCWDNSFSPGESAHVMPLGQSSVQGAERSSLLLCFHQQQDCVI